MRSAQEWIAKGIGALSRVRAVLPDGTGIESGDQVLAWLEAHAGEAIIDATELGVEPPRAAQGPGQSPGVSYGEAQKPDYSGKAHTHTMKAQVLSDPEGNLLCVGDLVGAATHDFALPPDSGWARWLEGLTLGGDRGYQGLEDLHPDARIPYKKPRGAELTETEKAYNRLLSSWRIAVEHAIGKLKVWKVLRRVKLKRRRLQAVFWATFVLTTHRQAWP